jgi:cadherin-like protein
VNPSAYNYLAVGESAVIRYTYDVIDGNGGLVAQMATITITGVNDGPHAEPHTFSVAQDGSVSGNLLQGATDPDSSDHPTVARITGANGAVAYSAKRLRRRTAR